MNRIKLLALMLLCTIAAMAQAAADGGTRTLRSPNENMLLWFGIDGGRPCYSIAYKQRPVVKRSYLGLQLAKDKHASKKMDETDLMDGFELADSKESTFDETWKPYGAKRATYATTTTSWRLR